jgi:hypothetical protein
MAVAAIALGIAGALLGLIPILGLFALIAGILAIVFGAMGRRNAARPDVGQGRGLATTGIVTGVIALVLGAVGVSIVNNAFDELGNTLDEIDIEGTDLIGRVVLDLDTCDDDGAHGTVVNNHTASVNITIDARFVDDAGTQVDTGVAFVNGLRPGSKATWDASLFGTEYARCQAEVSSVYED